MEKIALALGGGGFKGVAHLGVITALQELGFEISAISGTSIGGLIGGLYATGLSPEEIADAMKELDRRSLFKRDSLDGPSLLGISGLRSALHAIIGERTFADTRIPFACTAVDISRNRELYLQHGPLMDALTATMAIPGVLPPVIQGDSILVDGGVLDPVPVLLARHLAPDTPVIAVSLYPAVSSWEDTPTGPLVTPSALPFKVPNVLWDNLTRMRFTTSLRIFAQSMELCLMMMGELRLAVDKPEIILRPLVYDTGILDFRETSRLIEAGRDAVAVEAQELARLFTLTGKAQQFIRRYQPVESPPVVDDHPELGNG